MPHIDIRVDQIPIDRPLRLEHAGTAIVVLRTKESVTAFHDRCPHAQWPLSGGELTNGILQCPGHGWQFDVATGRCVDSPVYCLKPVSVVVSDDRVRLEWDAPAPERESVNEAIV
jgi:nitrite reductase/ring-hydroxylating ferredoxin subunit